MQLREIQFKPKELPFHYYFNSQIMIMQIQNSVKRIKTILACHIQ